MVDSPRLRATSAVRSVERSSTTMISSTDEGTSATVLASVTSALYAGMTTMAFFPPIIARAQTIARQSSSGPPRPGEDRVEVAGRRSTLPPAVNARQVLSHSTEWVLRSRALRAARAEVIPRGDRRDHAIRQARLLLEVARRVAEPVERLPQGSRTAVRLGLTRDAVYWVLVGTRSGAGD